MARIALPHLHLVASKGRRYVYDRRDAQRLAIPDADGAVLPDIQPPSASWLAGDQRIHAGFASRPQGAPAAGSLAVPITAYLATPDFHDLAAKARLDDRRTGAVVDLPAEADLAVVLVTETKRPFTVDHVRHTMRAAYAAAGLSADCVSHRLRYTAATRLREMGCDWEAIAAVTGHETAEMVRKYSTKRRMAAIAVRRLETKI